MYPLPSGGFYLNTKSFPPGSQWLVYCSYIYYSFSALIVNEFEGQTFECDPQQTGGCVLTGKELIHNLGLGKMTIFVDLLCLGALTMGFLCISFAALVCFKDKYLPMRSARVKRHVSVKLNTAGNADAL